MPRCEKPSSGGREAPPEPGLTTGLENRVTLKDGIRRGEPAGQAQSADESGGY